MKYDNGSQRSTQYSRLFVDGLQRRGAGGAGHDSSVPGQGKRVRERESAQIKHSCVPGTVLDT